jgi:predicted nucleic acid-binding protein
MRILVDTNVLVRSVEVGHGQHQASVDAMEGLRRQHQLLTVPQVFYEFWAVVTRPIANNGLGMTPTEAHAAMSDIKRLIPVLRDERAILAFWEHLVSSLGVRGKQSHDAHLAAAMQRHAVTHLLTFNSADFARFTFVTTLSPMDIVSGTSPV